MFFGVSVNDYHSYCVLQTTQFTSRVISRTCLMLCDSDVELITTTILINAAGKEFSTLYHSFKRDNQVSAGKGDIRPRGIYSLSQNDADLVFYNFDEHRAIL